MPGSFFDSNVLLYIASDEPFKARRAEDLVLTGGTISVQVLNEIANVGRRKMRKPWPDLLAFIGILRDLLRVVPVTIETHELGLRLARRFQLSTYDAMVLAAAVLDGCDRIWTEDMQHGLRVDGTLLITNPFWSNGLQST